MRSRSTLGLLHGATPLIEIVHALPELRRAGDVAHIAATLLVGNEAAVFAGAPYERGNC